MAIAQCRAIADFIISILLASSILYIQAEKNSIFVSSNGQAYGEAMLLSLKDNLPFVTVTVTYNGRTTEISNVLIDTGSASTILSADIVQTIQITPSPEDTLYSIRGVGGNEVVFSRQIDNLKLGEREINNFEIEIGGMDYGFEINGILGTDFLTQAGAIINFRDLTIEFAK